MKDERWKMRYNLSFHSKAWDEYVFFQTQDQKTLKKINSLLKSISRGDFDSIGKPEKLKENFSGCVSLRINKKDRLVYRINGDQIQIIQIKCHYND